MCKTVPFVQTTAVVTGILTMTCIAIERYQGIVFPLKVRREHASKRAYKMLGRTVVPCDARRKKMTRTCLILVSDPGSLAYASRSWKL